MPRRKLARSRDVKNKVEDNYSGVRWCSLLGRSVSRVPPVEFTIPKTARAHPAESARSGPILPVFPCPVRTRHLPRSKLLMCPSHRKPTKPWDPRPDEGPTRIDWIPPTHSRCATLFACQVWCDSLVDSDCHSHLDGDDGTSPWNQTA